MSLSRWKGVPGPVLAYEGLNVHLPADWLVAPSKDGRLLVTRDGLLLQQIGVYKRALNEWHEGRFKDWSRVPTPYELMQEQMVEMAAFSSLPVDVVSDEVKREKGSFPMAQAAPDPSTVRMLSNRATRLFGQAAFELNTRSYNAWGLEYRTRLIGATYKGQYWLVYYQAPALHYFDKDLPVFEALLIAFSGLDAAPGK